MKYFNKPFLLCLLLSLLLVYGFLVIGATRNVSEASANETMTQIDQLRTNFTSSSFGWLSIFQNNYMITLLTLAPFVGLPQMLLVQYNTGLLVAGLAKATHVSSLIYVFVIAIHPVGVLEYFAYLFAYAEGLFSLYAGYKRKLGEWFKTHFLWTLLFCSLILLGAAVVEWLWFL
jgi:Na+/H+-dicarboxylate symporter